MDTTRFLEIVANKDAPFTSHEVCELAGVTYRQLDYWVRSGLLTPCLRLNDLGSGRPREWDIEAVLEVVVIANLQRVGFDIQRLRDVDIIEFAESTIDQLDDTLRDVLNLARALDGIYAPA